MILTFPVRDKPWPANYLTKILDKTPDTSRILPGGSGLNTLRGLAHLGHSCVIVGKVGRDDKKELLVRDLKKLGIETHFQDSSLPTGQSLCFITPDAHCAKVGIAWWTPLTFDTAQSCHDTSCVGCTSSLLHYYVYMIKDIVV